MDRTNAPVVVLGAGYGGLTAALALAKKAKQLPGQEVVLVNKHEYHQFITELHKPAAGSADGEYIRIKLKTIIGSRPVRVVKGTVERIDAPGRRLIFEDGSDLPFSKLIVGVGSEPEYFGIDGLADNCFTLRSLNCARIINEHIRYQLAAVKLAPQSERAAYLNFVIGGAGLTGVEMAGELAEVLPRLAKQYDINPEEIQVFNIEAIPEIMRDFGTELAKRAARDLERKGIRLMTGVPLTKVDSEAIHLGNGMTIPTHTVIWSGGVRASRLLDQSGFTSVARGRASVDGGMRSVDNPDIFVVGDCAAGLDPESGRMVAPTAHNAIDQGLVAAHNVLTDLGVGLPETFRPVDLGAVASLGESFAVGKVGNLKLIGRPATIMKEMIELKWIFSLGGVGLVLRRLPRLIHLVHVTVKRRIHDAPLVGPKTSGTNPPSTLSESTATRG